MNVGVFGIGLIGGSLSIQIRKHFPGSKILGFDKSEKNLNRAIDIGLADLSLQKEDIKFLDLILITIPVNAVEELIIELLNQINDGALIIDFSSTKRTICEAASNHPKRDQFLATHPIAGTEFSGPDSALDDLFSNKIQIERIAIEHKKRNRTSI